MPTADLITLARAREAVLQKDEPPISVAVAPLACRGTPRPWEGTLTRKPWEHQVTAAIPHLETPETLPVLLELLSLQTVRPYVLILDTGSSPDVVRWLEALRRPDVEIHYLRAHAFAHSSAPVTTAMDLAFALCRTPYLFCTHSDVFPRRRDLLEWLLGLCRDDQPVVGYEMSPRPDTNGWRNVVSHTCTMLHMPAMRRVGATWSFERYWESGEARPQQGGYPDTEQPFDRCIRRAGIFPYLIGHDENYVRYTDANIDHVRSLSGLRLYDGAGEMHRGCEANLKRVLGEAKDRLQAWRKEAAVALKDLITSGRAVQDMQYFAGNATTNAILQTLITAISDAIEKYCRRRFVGRAYDELYDGNGDRRLLLRQYPIQSVQSVRYRPVTVLKVVNNATAQNQQARVQVAATGLQLWRSASGVPITETPLTWAAYPTINALANAVSVLGNGWAAQIVGDAGLTGDYGLWPSADLYVPGSFGDPLEGIGVQTSQGNLTARGQNAELKLHTYELAGYQWDARGWLLRAIPYTDPELLHPEDLIWPVGVANFRIQYTAGYTTVPEAVQEACARWVAIAYNLTQRDPSVASQTVSGAVGQTWPAGPPSHEPPPSIRPLLAPYRRHTIATDQG